MADLAQLKISFEANNAQLKKSLDEVNSKLTELSNPVKKISGEFKKASSESKKELQGLQKEIASAGAKIKDSLVANFALGSIVANGVTSAISALTTTVKTATIDWESAFAGVRKTVNATESELAILETGLLDLSQTIPVEAGSIALIAELGGQLGIAKDNILSFTDTMAKVAVTTNLTAEEASLSFAQIANVIGLPQEQIGNMASSVVHLGNNLATTESNIVNFAQNIAGAGKIVGLTAGDILGISGAMSSVGIEAEAGGTAVQKALLKINEATIKGGDNLRSFAQVSGISATEFKQLWEQDAGQAFALFVNGLGEAGDSASGILEELIGADVRLQRAFLSLANAGDLVNNAITSSNEAFKENVALSEEAGKRFETTASKLTLLYNNIVVLFQEVLSNGLPAFNGLVTVLSGTIGVIADNTDVIFPLVSAVGALTLGIVTLNNISSVFTKKNALYLGITAITGATIYLIKNWNTLGEGTQSLIKIFGILAGSIGVVVGAIKVVRIAQVAWNVAMSANPIGAVITVVVALGVAILALAKNWDIVVRFTKTALQKIKLEVQKGLIQLVQSLTDKFPSIAKLLGFDSASLQKGFGDIQRELVIVDGQFSDVTGKIKNSASDMVDSIKEAVGDLGSLPANNAISGLGGTIASTTNVAKQNLDSIKDKVSEVENKFKEYQDLIKEKSKAESDIQKSIQNALDKTKEKYLDIARSIREDLTKSQEAYLQKVQNIQAKEREEIAKTQDSFAKSVADRLTKLDEGASKQVDSLSQTQEKERIKLEEGEKKKQELIRKVAKDFGITPDQAGGILSDNQLALVETKLQDINGIKLESQRQAQVEYQSIQSQNTALKDQIDNRQKILDTVISTNREELNANDRNKALSDLNNLLQEKFNLETRNDNLAGKGLVRTEQEISQNKTKLTSIDEEIQKIRDLLGIKGDIQTQIKELETVNSPESQALLNILKEQAKAEELGLNSIKAVQDEKALLNKTEIEQLHAKKDQKIALIEEEAQKEIEAEKAKVEEKQRLNDLAQKLIQGEQLSKQDTQGVAVEDQNKLNAIKESVALQQQIENKKAGKQIDISQLSTDSIKTLQEIESKQRILEQVNLQLETSFASLGAGVDIAGLAMQRLGNTGEAEAQRLINKWQQVISLMAQAGAIAQAPAQAQPQYASGGLVQGAGSETSDSILARLSNNEFVMNAKAVKTYGLNFMNSLNQMKLPIPKFNTGGAVNTSNNNVNNSRVINYTQNITPNTNTMLDLRKLNWL